MTPQESTESTEDEEPGGPPRPDADRAMDRYSDGDDQAFAVVYDAVAPRVTAYVRRRVRDPELASDVIQQTFLHMHRARATFMCGGAALPWAFAIARRLIIDAARARRARPSPVPLEPGLLADPVVAGEDQVYAHEAARRIAAELVRLPPLQRQAFQLLKQEGLTLKQAAGVLGTTVTAVKLRVHRAVAALRSVLERDLPG
jgi:RNA polymerase sigma-70 factor (ECF subfamily)